MASARLVAKPDKFLPVLDMDGYGVYEEFQLHKNTGSGEAGTRTVFV